jgi:uracil-DNA glycosylase
VEAHRPASHSGLGWERLTDTAISRLSSQRSNIVFMLWGSHAAKKAQLIDAGKHLILRAPHPSPLSAYRGFFGCKHFSKANEYLTQHNIAPIIW